MNGYIQVGGSLTLTSKHGLGIIAGVDPTMGPAVDVYPSAQIKFHGGTEEITAVFSICGKDYPVTRKVEKLPSDEFGGLPAPSVTYATACGGFARVENVLPGALVTLFANGTAIAKQPCPLRAARIEAPLDAGDVVHARQQIGGRSSLFGSGAIAQGGPNGEWYYAGKLDILPVHSALLHDPTDPRKARVLL